MSVCSEVGPGGLSVVEKDPAVRLLYERRRLLGRAEIETACCGEELSDRRKRGRDFGVMLEELVVD